MSRRVSQWNLFIKQNRYQGEPVSEASHRLKGEYHQLYGGVNASAPVRRRAASPRLAAFRVPSPKRRRASPKRSYSPRQRASPTKRAPSRPRRRYPTKYHEFYEQLVEMGEQRGWPLP